ncbi:MAG: T9SS C-terminal target domain-containing protein, partial [Candidatus Zixiibacteriota bacterium]
VTLTIHDILGRKVRTLVRDYEAAGSHQVSWDATNDAGAAVASGIYLYRLEVQATGQTIAKKMILLE